MSRRFTLLRREAAANANAVQHQIACRITSENRLSPETFLDAHWREYFKNTSARLQESSMVFSIVTCPSGRSRLVSRSSITVALCLRHLLGQDGVGLT
jgi:hypothetical protein